MTYLKVILLSLLFGCATVGPVRDGDHCNSEELETGCTQGSVCYRKRCHQLCKSGPQPCWEGASCLEIGTGEFVCDDPRGKHGAPPTIK